VRKYSYASIVSVASGGVKLFGGDDGVRFLNQLKNSGSGVILLEGRDVFKGALQLEISDGTTVLFRSDLNLSLAGVENMFRHLNLIQELSYKGAPALEDAVAGGSTTRGGEKTRPGEPLNYPDSEADGPNNPNPKYVVWVHGFNVNGQQARAWHSEMFKRLYWAGSKARFVGVSWYGFDGQVPLADTSLDYHSNVDHAFSTAMVFGPRLKPLVGNLPVTVIAHSLGNMLVSSYLSDYHLSLAAGQRPNIVNYLMLNAAVPLEAYLGDQQDLNSVYSADNSMVHSDWYGYKKRLGATEWYRLFDDQDPATVTDQRETLTWRNRFAGFPPGIGYYSFYSTGEDVLATYAGNGLSLDQVKKWEFGRNSWVLQEKWKGRAPIGGAGYGGTTVMGWGFNSDDYYPYIPWEADTADWLAQKKLDANTKIMSNELIEKPFFRRPMSLNGLSTLFDPVIGGPGSDYAADHRNWLLAEALPALTLPTGGHDGERMKVKLNKNNIFDMNANKNGWPVERIKQKNTDWWHSDIKDIAFSFTYKVIAELLRRGGLK